MMLRTFTVAILLTFATLTNPAVGQQPIDIPDQKYSDIPDISLDGIDWSGLEVNYQSDEIEHKPWHNKIDGRARIQQRKLEILHRETEGVDAMERFDAEIPETMDVIIHINNSSVINDLRELGFRKNSEYSVLVTGSIPFQYLTDAAELDDVRYIESAPEFRSDHDLSIPDIRADLVHDGGGGLSTPYRGEDVVVGIVDSGIDFTHPDFNTDDGTRIQYLVELLEDDDERSGDCPSEFDIDSEDGNCIEWTAEDIDDDPDGVTQIDGQNGGGHGTHVAGSAAGGGRADSDMAGVAPDSDIITVNASRNPDGSRSFAFADIVNATRYIFNRADEMGKPAVVNLSLGAFSGPRDGTTGPEQILNEYTDNGQIVVSSAGNSGFDPAHTGGDLAPSNRYIAPVVVTPEAQPPVSSVELEAWYETGTVSELKIVGIQTDDDQAEVIGQTPWLRPGDDMDEEVEITKDGETMGYLLADASVINADINGDSQLSAEIFTTPFGEELDNTQWVVVVNSSIRGGRFDMWVNSGGFIHPRNFQVGGVEQLTGSSENTVTIPASASDVLSVGAHIARDFFTPEDEICEEFGAPPECTLTLPVPTNPLNPQQDRNPRLGELAYFSSKGPMRTDDPAVDITAPGFLIYSTLSGDVDPPQEALIRPGGDYILNNGTSMAAPHVAGAVALMLEANPTLSVSDIRSLFAETGREDSFTESLPNNEFGNGKLDVLAAMEGPPATPSKLANTSADQPEEVELTNYPNPFNPVTTVSFALPEAKEVTVEVFNSLGQQVQTLVSGEEHEAGTHEFNFDGSSLSSGVYLIRMQAGDQQLSRPVMLVK